jgi:hypothetical protein
MPSQASGPLTDELREILVNLAEGLFPLARWVAEPTKYVPPQSDLPWRQAGQQLTPKRLGVIEFFENLLNGSAAEAELLARWAQVDAQLAKMTPDSDLGRWRAARKLQVPPSFGLAQSANVPLDGEGKPVARADFYALCWPLLVTAVAGRQPAGPDAWEALALELFNDRCPQWPISAGVKSSTFATQFAKDLLYAMLDMRTPASDPWRFALLIELGEHRRVGNAYTPEDVRKTVYALRARLSEYAT